MVGKGSGSIIASFLVASIEPLLVLFVEAVRWAFGGVLDSVREADVGDGVLVGAGWVKLGDLLSCENAFGIRSGDVVCRLV